MPLRLPENYDSLAPRQQLEALYHGLTEHIPDAEFSVPDPTQLTLEDLVSTMRQKAINCDRLSNAGLPTFEPERFSEAARLIRGAIASI